MCLSTIAQKVYHSLSRLSKYVVIAYIYSGRMIDRAITLHIKASAILLQLNIFPVLSIIEINIYKDNNDVNDSIMYGFMVN